MLSVYLGVAQHAQYYVSTNYVPTMHQQLHLITLFVCFTHIWQVLSIMQQLILLKAMTVVGWTWWTVSTAFLTHIAVHTY